MTWKENNTWHCQREIKFRAFVTDTKEMIYSSDKQTNYTFSMYLSEWLVLEKFDKSIPRWKIYIHSTIMQYTWLKDKNWKEVREGDVYRKQSYIKRHDNQCNDSILLTDFLCQVVRDNGWFASKIIQRNVEKNDNFYREQRSKEQREKKMSGTMSLSIYEEWRINEVVIWDIHTTPDLLSDINSFNLLPWKK